MSSKVPCSCHSMSLEAGQRREEPMYTLPMYQAAAGPLSASPAPTRYSTGPTLEVDHSALIFSHAHMCQDP